MILKILANVVFVTGEVDNPGVYLVEENFNQDELLEYMDIIKKIHTSTDKKTIDVKNEMISLRGDILFPSDIKINSTLNLSDLLEVQKHFKPQHTHYLL